MRPQYLRGDVIEARDMPRGSLARREDGTLLIRWCDGRWGRRWPVTTDPEAAGDEQDERPIALCPSCGRPTLRG
jgi:hypothetical protein